MKLVLKDNSEIELIQYTSNAFVVLCADEEAFYSIWDKMTPENLSRVHIDDNGTTALIFKQHIIIIVLLQVIFISMDKNMS